VVRSGYQRSIAAVNLAVIFWGITPVFVKASEATSSALLTYRLVISAPLALLFFAREKSRFTRSIFLSAMIPALFFYISTGSGYVAFQKTSIANAMLISQLAPVIVLFAAPILFKESIDWRRMSLAILALAGAGLVILGGEQAGTSNVVGDLWAGLNCVTWATYFLIVKKQRTGGAGVWEFLAPVMLWASLFSVIGALLFRQSLQVSKTFDWLMILSVGVLSLSAHALLTWAQNRMEAITTSLLMLGMPIVSAISAFLVFAERLSLLQSVGGITVVASLALVTKISSQINKSQGSYEDRG
jgi:drug/metabolite transporter (DMT)-like permease